MSMQKISYINELQNLKKAYYHEESEKDRLRKMAQKHAKNGREILKIIFKKIDQAK